MCASMQIRLLLAQEYGCGSLDTAAAFFVSRCCSRLPLAGLRLPAGFGILRDFLRKEGSLPTPLLLFLLIVREKASSPQPSPLRRGVVFSVDRNHFSGYNGTRKTLIGLIDKLMATSKNCFLMVWARDFVLTKVLKIPEYFVYCGVFKAHCQGKRSVQTAKG